MTTTDRRGAEYRPEAFWNERYSRLDLTRSGHRDLPEAYNRWLYRRKQAVLRGRLRAIGFSPAGKRLLEIGAGTGAYIDFWRSLGVESITGLDISGTAVEFLRGRYPQCTFASHDITAADAPLERGAYDLVTSLDVLYHVVDDAKLAVAMDHIAGALAPGGLFAMHDQFLHRPSEHRGYIRWRSLADWQRILATAGLEIVSRTPIFFTMIQMEDCASPRTAARMDAWWDRFNRFVQRFPSATGAAAYGVDTALGAVLREGPSMELLLARRKPGGAAA
jgi:cyclopropane fatty-acyl-phospholipid synthase-like methyltransferase